jgi:hypothetical protein
LGRCMGRRRPALRRHHRFRRLTKGSIRTISFSNAISD